MKDEQLQETLEAIANDAIPEDIDLWEEIEMQLLKDSMPRRTPFRRLAQVAALVIMLMTVSTGVYAVVNQIIDDGDETIRTLSEADLVTVLDQEQTVDGITLTLDWAYADANRIALAYQTMFDETQVAQPEFGFVFEHDLSTADGQPLPQFLGGGGGGGGGGASPMRFSAANANYDPSGLAISDGTIDLQLAVTAYAYIPPELRETLCPLADPNGESTVCEGITAPQNGGSGGGGGGGGPAPESSDLPPRIPVAEYVPKTITVDFSLPVYPMIERQPEQTVEASGQAVTLQSAAITPSLTELEVCFPQLDAKPGRVVGLTLSAGTTERFFTAWYDVYQVQDDCINVEYSFPILPDVTDTLTVNVEYIRNRPEPTQANADALTAKVRELLGEDIQLDFHEAPDGSINLIGIGGSADIDHNTQQSLIEQAYYEIAGGITGPWTFTLDLTN